MEENQVDFRVAPFNQLAHRAQGYLGTFLVSLAAYQRGLQVSFLYDSELVQSASRTGGERQVGRSFALSDGSRVVRLSSTAGPKTSQYASRVTRHKHTMKDLFAAHSIPTPTGMLSSKQKIMSDIEKISRLSGANRFVIKPYDGSLARDTYVNLTEDEVLELVDTYPFEDFILEEHVTGPEYRFTVVNERCVGVFERKAPFVVGDGARSISTLVDEKNQKRERNPFLQPKPIVLSELIDDPDKLFRLKERVPDVGEVVKLSELQRVGVGGEPWDVSDAMPQCFKDLAIRVCSAIKAGNTGVDIIIGDLSDTRTARVLEANVRHHIEGHSFCENKEVWDNKVAEAIVEMYFPETKGRRHHASAVFDHRLLRRALETQCISALHLPRLGDDWVSWTFRVGTSSNHKAVRKSISPTIAEFGLYACEATDENGLTHVNVTGPAREYENFLNKTSIVSSLKLADEIDAIRGR